MTRLTPGLMTGICALTLLTGACRRDMQDQPKYKPLQGSDFFSDGRSARPIPEGAIAVDDPVAGDVIHTGHTNGTWSAVIPVPVDRALLERGRERFDIFCSPCHSRLGDGNGMVAQRGVKQPANLHSDRVRREPPGYLFDVITNGFGGMGDYGDQIPVPDRWAIVAYIEALQLSEAATVADVPPEARDKLGEGQ